MLPKVSAILLAAGHSKRMGRPKQLLPVRNKPAVRICAETILAAGVKDVVAVLGSNSTAVANALAGLPIGLVFNRDPKSEMAESVRIGLERVDPAATGVLICLADHPLVQSESISNLVSEHTVTPHYILVPLYNGKRGHPTLFPRSFINEIHDGRTLRDINTEHSAWMRFISVNDEGVVLDMDREEDYLRVKKLTS